MAKLRPPVKTHGGKYYLADWVIDNFPENYEELSYGEIFVGGGSVFLNKKRSIKECIYDADWNVISIWEALRNQPVEFYNRLKSLKYAEETFKLSCFFLLAVKDLDSLDLAVHEYVVRRMSRGGMRKAFAWSERLRGGKPGDLNAWETALEALPRLAARLEGVGILGCDFRTSIPASDGPEHLLYLDPPYLKSTRAKGATEVYQHEMTNEDHEEMLKLCVESKSKILLSGYESTLYDSYLGDWKKVYKDVKNHSAQNLHKATKREVLWKNY